MPSLIDWSSSVFMFHAERNCTGGLWEVPGLLLHLDWANASVLIKRFMRLPSSFQDLFDHRCYANLFADTLLVPGSSTFHFTMWHESTPKQEVRDVASLFSHSISSWE